MYDFMRCLQSRLLCGNGAGFVIQNKVLNRIFRDSHDMRELGYSMFQMGRIYLGMNISPTFDNVRNLNSPFFRSCQQTTG